MKIAVIVLNENGRKVGERIIASYPQATLYLRTTFSECTHRVGALPDSSGQARSDMPALSPLTLLRVNLVEGVAALQEGNRSQVYTKLSELIPHLFEDFEGLIFIMALGIVIRVIAPFVKDKKSDPAVVVVDEASHFVISALSGHKGGANQLALEISNLLGAEPVITTASESKKNLIVGIGCRRNTGAEEIIRAIKKALRKTGRSLQEVRYIVSGENKKEELGLEEAAAELGVFLRFIPFHLLKTFQEDYNRSSFVRKKIGVDGLCEPAALIASKNGRLVLPKEIYGCVTVAVAEEVK